MDDQVFNLKFNAKMFEKYSKKCEKKEAKQKLEVKKALEKGNVEAARIYASNAIREKNQALSYLRVSAKLEGIAARVEQHKQMSVVTKSMSQIVSMLDKFTKQQVPLEQVTKIMDSFERVDEGMQVQTEYVNEKMNSVTASTTPVDQVDELIASVAEEHGLKVMEQLSRPVMSSKLVEEPQQQTILNRLEKLKA